MIYSCWLNHETFITSLLLLLSLAFISTAEHNIWGSNSSCLFAGANYRRRDFKCGFWHASQERLVHETFSSSMWSLLISCSRLVHTTLLLVIYHWTFALTLIDRSWHYKISRTFLLMLIICQLHLSLCSVWSWTYSRDFRLEFCSFLRLGSRWASLDRWCLWIIPASVQLTATISSLFENSRFS